MRRITGVDLKLVVVGGSRSLLSVSTARTEFSSLLERHIKSATLVCHGGAIGPDSWADVDARNNGVARIVFGLKDGRPHAIHGTRKMDLPEADKYAYDSVNWKSRPLERNAQMVRWAAERKMQGVDVTVLGFVDGQSSTRGTDHMLRRATALGLTVVRYELPQDKDGTR